MGIAPVYKIGKKETIGITAHIKKGLTEWQKKGRWIMEGLRQAGHLRGGRA